MAVVAGKVAARRACINNVGITPIRSDVSTLAAAHRIPIPAADHEFVVVAAGDTDSAVVLLRPVNVVWKTVVGDYMIELRRGLVFLRGPSLAAVRRDGGAAIVGID